MLEKVMPEIFLIWWTCKSTDERSSKNFKHNMKKITPKFVIIKSLKNSQQKIEILTYRGTNSNKLLKLYKQEDSGRTSLKDWKKLSIYNSVLDKILKSESKKKNLQTQNLKESKTTRNFIGSPSGKRKTIPEGNLELHRNEEHWKW